MHLAYVDCSNLFIEAQKISAVARGLAPNLAVNQRHTSDFAYRLDFHRLMALLREAGDPLRAAVFGSITDTNEASWAHAQAAGFDVQVVERDGDYEPLVRQLMADRFHVTLLFWAHASRELRRPASHFYTLDPYIAELALG